MKTKALFLILTYLFFSSMLSAQMKPDLIVKRIHTLEKVVALTFDDGPNKEYTESVLKILRKNKVKATFFLVAKNVLKYPALAQKIKAEGHEIGNHSLNHFDYSLLTEDAVLEDVLISQTIFYQKLGNFPLFFRPPYGNLDITNYAVLDRYFEKIVKWSIDPKDWDPTTNRNKILNIVFKHLKPGSIIILHDNNKTSLKALPKIIKKAKKLGYRFETLEGLLN
jgi:peptidoglycan-N-acetylglucosamine deacetylase